MPNTDGVSPNSAVLQSDPDGLLDRRIRPIRALEKKRPSRHKRWLCEKARAGAAMQLSCMH